MNVSSGLLLASSALFARGDPSPPSGGGEVTAWTMAEWRRVFDSVRRFSLYGVAGG